VAVEGPSPEWRAWIDAVGKVMEGKARVV